MDTLKLSNQLCFPLYAATKAVIKAYTPLLEPFGITYTQYITMMVLWEYQPVTVKDLGEKLYLDSGTLTPLLKKLEKLNYVKRHRSTYDERVVEILLTVEGMALKDKLKHIPQSLMQMLPLNDEEAKQLYETLYRLIHKIY